MVELTLPETIERARRRRENALLRALSVMVVDLAAIIHQRHPEDLRQLLQSSRLELQAVRGRRSKSGDAAMWQTVVDLLELAPAQADAVHGPSAR